MICILGFLLASCETQQSLTRKRTKSVERGLIRAIYFKGQKPEKMLLTERMRFYRVPGVSLTVLDKSQIEWAKAYGVKDVATNELLSPENLLQAASLSQPVAAAIALHLVEKGRLELEGDINGMLHTWKLPPGPLLARNKITLMSLLTHSSGLSPQDLSGFSQEEQLSTLKQMLDGEKPSWNPPVDVEFVPGTQVRYSESGYLLLEQLLVDVERKPFSDLAKKLIFQPLGLKNSTFEHPLSKEKVNLAATGHRRNGQAVEGKWYHYPQAAAKGLWTTPSEYASFIVEILQCAMGKAEKIISPSMARKMLTPQVRNRGFGFVVEGEGEELHFYLQGKTPGFSSFVVVYPYRGQGTVIMTNSDNGMLLIEEMLRAISACYEWPHFKPQEKPLYRLDASVYQQYVGKYVISPDYILDVNYEDYYLVIQPTGQARTKFYVESETIFFSVDPFIRIQFRRDDRGKVTHLVLWQEDFEQVARKIG